MKDQKTREWKSYRKRYALGEWRAPIFRDMILDEARKLNPVPCQLSFLDIGCGDGFDGDQRLQQSIADFAGCFIGIEPDSRIFPIETFNRLYRCRFQDAGIDPNSIDIAYAVMVLEHFENPDIFFNKIHRILRPGGIFLGFTMDARHWFVVASLITEWLHIKDLYLNFLQGRKSETNYENYPVYYKSNTPERVCEIICNFSRVSVLNFSKIGEVDYYIPKKLRFLTRAIDRFFIKMRWPGSVIAIRAEK